MLAHVEQSGFILVRVGSKWGHGCVIFGYLWGPWGLMQGYWGHHGDLHGAAVPLDPGQAEIGGSGKLLPICRVNPSEWDLRRPGVVQGRPVGPKKTLSA